MVVMSNDNEYEASRYHAQLALHELCISYEARLFQQ